MNVLFVNPGYPYGVKESEDSEFVNNMIKTLKDEGHIVEVIDSVKEKLNWRELNLKILEFEPKAIVMEFKDLKNNKDAAEILKDLSDALIITFGEFATNNSEKIMVECEAVDVLMKGMSEKIIVNVLDKLDDLETVKGILFRENEQILETKDES